MTDDTIRESVEAVPEMVTGGQAISSLALHNLHRPMDVIRQTEAQVRWQAQEQMMRMGAASLAEPEITWRCEIRQQVIRRPEEIPPSEWIDVVDLLRERARQGRVTGPVAIHTVPLPEEDSPL